MIPLGPFDLIRPIGRGGSCEVWRGVHRDTDLPVAVKIVFGKKARAPRFISSFREEVRAVAGLNHPSIVMVFDYGLIPEEAAAQAGGKLEVGAPYLVMELGEDTLHAFCDRLPWSRIYRILLALLDGLAHAHARGVIHRDIKPANILVCDQQRQVKLSDFGLAHGVEHTEAPKHAREILGTPSYMAPEQFELRWRDYGPWTDLYALGCTTYTLLCGFPPFGRTAQLEDMMAAHLYQPIPALPPRLPVPPGFSHWIQRLLQKDPSKRFQCAADAAWSLMQLQHQAPVDGVESEWEETARTSPFAPRVSFGEHGVFDDSDEPSLHTLQSLVGGTPTPSVLPAYTDELQRTFRPDDDPTPPPQTRQASEQLNSQLGDGRSTQEQLSVSSVQSISPGMPKPLAAKVHASLRETTDLSPPQKPPVFRADASWDALPGDLAEETINHPPASLSFPLGNAWQPEKTLEGEPLVDTPPAGTSPVEPPSALGPPETTRSLRGEFNEGAAPGDVVHPVPKDEPGLSLVQTEALEAPLRDPGVLVGRQAPPFPETWRRRALTERSRLLDDVGLGLYGLRTVPLVAREEERDQLWGALAKAVKGGEARVVSLTGPSGCGKSRLAQWLCERANEVGAAHVLKCVHSPIAGPSDGFGAMLSRYLRCAGLRRDQIQHRVSDGLTEQSAIAMEETRALTELIVPAANAKELGAAEPTIRFSDPSERYEVVRKFIERLCAERATILWLDDIHWSLDALSFVSYVMASQRWRPIPLLILMTSRPEALAEQRVGQDMMDAVMSMDLASKLEIGPLSDQDSSALVQELLGLRGELALQVEQRTAGNPLFAVQLVGDWVQRGLLVRSARGFSLAPNVQIEIPDDLHHVWIDRLAQVLETRPDHEWIALELAAALGIEVDREEWMTVCELASLPVPEALLETLFVQRLAYPTPRSGPGNWSFAHSMLRESLERHAREADRWSQHQAHCAEMLQDTSGPGCAVRLGRHLQLAGALQASLKPLLQGIWEHVDAGDYRLAELLYSDWKGTLTQLALPPHSSFWGEAWLLRCRIARVTGSYEQGGRLAAMLVKDARAHQWDKILIYALLEQANCGWRVGVDEDEVWLMLEEAEFRACERGEPRLEAECRRYMGNFLCLRGKLEEAARHLRAAYAIFESINANVGMARCCFGLSNVERQAGRYASARGHVKRAQKRYEASGIRRGIVDCLNSLGDLARFEGDLAQSEASYRDSLERYEALGAGDNSISKLNISLVLLHRKNYDEAETLLEETIAQLNQRGQRDLEGIAHLCMLPIMAAHLRWDQWRHHIATARQMLDEIGMCDVDSARVAEMAGDIAIEVQEYQHARDAYLLAIEQWQSLGREEDAAAVQARMPSMPG